MSTAWTTGLVKVKIPKDTLAVISGTSDAAYTQAVTVDDGGDDPSSFKGSGLGGVPLTLKDGMEYLKLEPSGTERELGFSFFYAKKADSTAWQSPKVQGPVSSRVNGVQMITLGSEDSTDNSWHDTALTIGLFPKKTPKRI